MVLRGKKAKEAIIRAKKILSRLDAEAENCANKIAIADATMVMVGRDTKTCSGYCAY